MAGEAVSAGRRHGLGSHAAEAQPAPAPLGSTCWWQRRLLGARRCAPGAWAAAEGGVLSRALGRPPQTALPARASALPPALTTPPPQPSHAPLHTTRHSQPARTPARPALAPPARLTPQSSLCARQPSRPALTTTMACSLLVQPAHDHFARMKVRWDAARAWGAHRRGRSGLPGARPTPGFWGAFWRAPRPALPGPAPALPCLCAARGAVCARDLAREAAAGGPPLGRLRAPGWWPHAHVPPSCAPPHRRCKASRATMTCWSTA